MINKLIAFCSVCLLCCFQLVVAQNYRVISVAGNIVKDGQSLKVGQEIQDPTAGLEYPDPEAVASLFHPDKGKWSLSRKGLTPIQAIMGGAVNRPALCKSPRAFGYTDKNEPYRYLVLGTLEQPVSEDLTPLVNPKEQYFEVSYVYNSQKIRRKLPSENNKVIISKENIFGDNNPDEASNIVITYNGNATTSTPVPFHPVFPDEAECKLEVEMIIAAYPGQSATILQKVLQHLKDFYGAPNQANVQAWLEDHFDLSF